MDVQTENRSFAMLDVRSVDETKRTFIGVANSAREDSHGTWIEPEGAVFTLPIPLFYHSRGEHAYIPFGDVIRTWVEGGKRWIEAHVPRIADDGTAGTRSVRDRLDAHWAEVKNGLVRGLSIDFQSIDPPRPPRRGDRVKKWAFRGLTVVPIPSNMDASVVSVRSILAASGDQKTPPGVSGPPTNTSPRRNMTIQEQISQHENSRAAKVAARDALLERSATDGRTLDESESEQFDTLDTEIRSIDAHLVRLNSAKKEAETRATPVNATNSNAASQSRGGVAVVSVRPNTEPGIGFARAVMALAACKGVRADAAEYAKETWGDAADEIVGGIRKGFMQTRAAVAPGSTTNSTFAAPFVNTTYLNEFLEMLRPQTLLGRIPKLRHVPFNVSMPTQTSGGTYKWVGQGKWKPVTSAQYAAAALTFAKASGIIVLTEELVRLSTPSAETAVRDELVKGIQQFLDVQLVDSTVSAVANVNPASITNGVTGTAASGATGAAARTDIAARVAALVALGYPISELVILMSESIAFNLGLMLNAVGAPLFPGLSGAGGEILGIPVVTSQSVGSQVIVAHGPSIMMADEGGIEIDVSREASLQLNDAPTDPVDATATLTSLWQANLVGLRVERFITWGKARSTAVDRITAAAYAA